MWVSWPYSLLQQFMGHTYMGKAIRATAQDGDASKLVGINTDRVMEIAFGLGTALASLAGSLMALIFAFDPDFGRPHLLKGFCIVVLGGLESMVGVALGALGPGHRRSAERSLDHAGHAGFRQLCAPGHRSDRHARGA